MASDALQSGPPHFVDLHVNPGESVSFQLFDGNETVLRGPATVTMISQHTFPPVPMPVQVPPGHMVQQIVDENGTLRHIILSAINENNQPPTATILPPGQTTAPPAAPGYSPYCWCCCTYLGGNQATNCCQPLSSSPLLNPCSAAVPSGPQGQLYSGKPMPPPVPPLAQPPPPTGLHPGLWEFGMTHVDSSTTRRFPFTRNSKVVNPCSLDMTFPVQTAQTTGAAIRRRLSNRNYSYSKKTTATTLNTTANGLSNKGSPTNKTGKLTKDLAKYSSDSIPLSSTQSSSILFTPNNINSTDLGNCELSSPPSACEQLNNNPTSKIDYILTNASNSNSNYIDYKSDKILDSNCEKVKSIATRGTCNQQYKDDVCGDLNIDENFVTTNGVHDSSSSSRDTSFSSSSPSSPYHAKSDNYSAIGISKGQNSNKKPKKQQDDKSRENTPQKRKSNITPATGNSQDVRTSSTTPKSSPAHKVSSNSSELILNTSDKSQSNSRSKVNISIESSSSSSPDQILVQSVSEILQKNEPLSNLNGDEKHLSATEDRISHRKEISLSVAASSVDGHKVQESSSSPKELKDSDDGDKVISISGHKSVSQKLDYRMIEQKTNKVESQKIQFDSNDSELSPHVSDVKNSSNSSLTNILGMNHSKDKPEIDEKTIASAPEAIQNTTLIRSNSGAKSGEEFNQQIQRSNETKVEEDEEDEGNDKCDNYSSVKNNVHNQLANYESDSDMYNNSESPKNMTLSQSASAPIPNKNQHDQQNHEDDEDDEDSDSVVTIPDDITSEEAKPKVKNSVQNSPKHLRPQIQVFALTHTSLTASSVKLKWTYDQGNSSYSIPMNSVYPLSETRHFMVEMIRNSQSNVKNGSVTPIRRIVYQGTQTSCRISHLSSHEQYSFRVRSYQDDLLLVSNILNLTTPEHQTVKRKSKGQTYQHQLQPYSEIHKHHISHHPDQQASHYHHTNHNQHQTFPSQVDENSIESSDQRCAIMIISLFTVIAVVVACLIHHLLSG